MEWWLNINYATTTITNLVSGEEQWFKAYSMEIVAMGMKSTLENNVQTLNTLKGYNYTIIQTVTDPVTNLTSEKMNFVFLCKTDDIPQTPAGINYKDILVEFGFGGQVIDTDSSSGQNIVYSIGKTNGQVKEIYYKVIYIPLPEGAAIYKIMDSTGTKELKAYFYFENKQLGNIIYGMVELFNKE